MVKSMTAYGRAVGTLPGGVLTVEIRSVNSRYFDCTVKLPRTHLCLEDRVRSYLQNEVISRGKVDVFLGYVRSDGGAVIRPNTGAALQYVAALRELAEACGVPDDITAMGLAKNPDLFLSDTGEVDADAEWAAWKPVIAEAGRAFDARRTEEGRRTEQDITEKMGHVTAWAKEAGERSRADIAGYHDKLKARLRQVLSDNKVTADEQRILTECALMADKLAVDEELARLDAHREAFFSILREGSPCGKKLDYLMQEFNRETNTLGSKACNAEIAHIVVSMKNELEKIREQVQNIE